VVLIIAGSGPTDRDGNQAAGLRTDLYWQMAHALASGGIASVRFDKRGVGASERNFRVADLVVGDLVDDVIALVDRIRQDPRTASITLAGHSEGGLLALLAVPRVHVDALALLATAGRPFGTVVRGQLARQLDATLMAEVDRLLADVRAGREFTSVPTPLRPLFNPFVERYLRSELDIDPVQLLHALHIPTVVVQGETDAQVSVDDARALGTARSDVRVVILPRTNHVFKEESTAALPQASYTNPDLPLVSAVIDAIASVVPATRP
jgi:pimeloyl-ACP methyl ester carboxylesterase